MTDMVDDYVGGAVSSGTVYYQNVHACLQGDPPDQLLLAQGLETPRMFRITLIPGTLDIREHDQMVLTSPTDHVYYNKSFRVTGVTYSNLNPRDRRNYMIVDVDRSVIAHSVQ